MKKRSKVVGLGLLVLLLVSALGAKMYSNITMGDNEWIGLGANAGRIVFDDQTTDEVSVLDALVGVGTTLPYDELQVVGTLGLGRHPSNQLYRYVLDSETSGNSSLSIGYKNTATGWYINNPALTLTYQGKVGVGNTTPSYDLDVTGDIRATEDVLVNETVFIGSVEDTDEDGDKMFTRADSADGGYAFWARKNLSGWPAAIVFQDAAMGGDTGPDLVLWVQWIVHDNTTGDLTEGDTFLYNGGGTTGQVVIGGSGDNTITLSFGRPLVGSSKAAVMLYEQGSHTFDVALLMMWVED